MKFRLIFNIFLSTFFLFTLTVFTQEKPKALKFDEFDDSVENQFYSYGEISLSQRTERFIKQLKKERGVRVYIIYYQARTTDSSNKTWINEIENDIRYNTKIKYEDVVSVDGGYKEKNTIEFWVVPKNAKPPEPPVPTPTVDNKFVFTNKIRKNRAKTNH